jgi:hypothetical protein
MVERHAPAMRLEHVADCLAHTRDELSDTDSAVSRRQPRALVRLLQVEFKAQEGVRIQRLDHACHLGCDHNHPDSRRRGGGEHALC